jgi:hypothetical protein
MAGFSNVVFTLSLVFVFLFQQQQSQDPASLRKNKAYLYIKGKRGLS